MTVNKARPGTYLKKVPSAVKWSKKPQLKLNLIQEAAAKQESMFYLEGLKGGRKFKPGSMCHVLSDHIAIMDEKGNYKGVPSA